MKKSLSYLASAALLLSVGRAMAGAAPAFRYQCRAVNAEKQVGAANASNAYADVFLTIGASQVSLRVKTDGGSQEYQGGLDANYKPRKNKNMLRVSFDDIGEDSVIQVLIDKGMFEGKEGIIKITDRSFEMPGNYVFQVDACVRAQ